MSKFLSITVRFLQPLSHGRGDGGEPEWPPSPLRVFQALVAAAAARWNERTRLDYAVPALEWLAKHPAPTVVASAGVASEVKYRLYVPDNVADKVAKSWRGGNANASIADYRTEKDVRPTHLIGKADEFASVHYLYPVADSDPEFATHKGTLVTAARSITHLGWGVDMVAGNAVEISEEEAAKLAGERWRPMKDATATQLRVPRAGTLAKLMEKHAAFLNRLSDGGFKPVPPLTAFDTVGYRRDTDSAPRPFAAFELNKSLDDMATQSTGSRFRPFETTRWAVAVAGMVRHATAAAARQSGREERWINTFVHGHTPDGTNRAVGEAAAQRFAFLPLPSIEHRGPKGKHVGMIRRVLVVGPGAGESEVTWARRALSGQELIEEGGRPVALLSAIPNADTNLQSYVASSRAWSTVTPVVLHRHDVRAPDEVRVLFETAFRHAGFSDEVVRALELEWRNVGFRAGVDLATQYRTPDTMTGPRYHVRVRFAHSVRGPLAVGAGRYRGLGLFATECLNSPPALPSPRYRGLGLFATE
jgi:CRISPR-associated protein Csb2